jgi:hypothetical protein
VKLLGRKMCLRRGIRVFGGVTGVMLAAVVAGLLNEGLGLWAAIAWGALLVALLLWDFVLRLRSR